MLQLAMLVKCYHLPKLGGSDQWGNITAGIDLIHKKKSDIKTITDSLEKTERTNAFGVTIPLLLTSTGEKFGKSAGNAIWLNDKITSAYEFYQVKFIFKIFYLFLKLI
jgi:tyrosyl-tRNA synthetase